MITVSWRCVIGILLGLALPPQLMTAEAVPPLVDLQATDEARALWQRLHRLNADGIMLGHQNANVRGIGWNDQIGVSDFEKTTGKRPAVYGYDIGWSFHRADARDQDVDRWRAVQVDAIRQAHAAGAVITISWHAYHPLGGGDSWKIPKDAIKQILPGGEGHDAFRQQLAAVAALFGELTDDSGKPIPLIFRPWHEHTGAWFWWGVKGGSEQDYIDLWRLTQRILRNDLGQHQLIWAYSPSANRGLKGYTSSRFPGMDHVDVLGFDLYVNGAKDTGLSKLDQLLTEVGTLAVAHGKLMAMTEFGEQHSLSRYQGETPWYSELLYPVLQRHQQRVSWLLLWANFTPDQFWVPVGAHGDTADFVHFSGQDGILTLPQTNQLNPR